MDFAATAFCRSRRFCGHCARPEVRAKLAATYGEIVCPQTQSGGLGGLLIAPPRPRAKPAPAAPCRWATRIRLLRPGCRSCQTWIVRCAPPGEAVVEIADRHCGPERCRGYEETTP